MYYPGAASIDCGDCHKWTYNLETGERQTRGQSGIPVKRDGEPPCRHCPKKSPENGKSLVLHPRNVRLLTFYKFVMVKGSVPEPYANDPLTLENLAIIKDLQLESDGKQELDRQLRLEKTLQRIGK